MYRNIINPQTGGSMNIMSQEGLKMIRGYIEELKNGDIGTSELIIEMAEAYVQFFDKNESNMNKNFTDYHKMTDALDEMRGQSLKKMIPLTYKAMYEIEKK